MPPVVWILLIYVLSSLPSVHLRFTMPPGSDKVVHAVIYFILCWLSYRAFNNQDHLPLLKRSAFFGAFIFSVAYGLLDEYHQSYVPGRMFDYYDLVADGGGALLFVATVSMYQRRNGKNGHSPKG